MCCTAVFCSISRDLVCLLMAPKQHKLCCIQAIRLIHILQHIVNSSHSSQYAPLSHIGAHQSLTSLLDNTALSDCYQVMPTACTMFCGLIANPFLLQACLLMSMVPSPTVMVVLLE